MNMSEYPISHIETNKVKFLCNIIKYCSVNIDVIYIWTIDGTVFG